MASSPVVASSKPWCSRTASRLLSPRCRGLGFTTWSDDGTIAFTSPDGLYRVPEGGGTPQLVLRPDPARGESEFFGLSALPGGALLVGAIPVAGSGARNHLSVLAHGATEAKTVMEGVAIAFFAGGALVYQQQKGRTAIRFDLEKLETVGAPVIMSQATPLPAVSPSHEMARSCTRGRPIAFCEYRFSAQTGNRFERLPTISCGHAIRVCHPTASGWH